MSYIQGYLIPVLPAKKEAYRKMAADMAPMFMEFGALRLVECWGDEVPKGKTTDMYGAVNAQGEENIVFSWVDWGTKETCDKAHEKMMQDERMQEMPPDMPFDGKRMVFAGFETLGESGNGGTSGYVMGYVAPVPRNNRRAFDEMCASMRDVAVDCGALHALDAWAETIEDGKVTDFKRAVKAETDEAIAFGYAEWPSKEAHEKGSAAMREDKRMAKLQMPLDGKRLIYGGFYPIVDVKA